MLEKAQHILDKVAEHTNEIVLFHSLSGKDSIAMLDLCYPRFERMVCVFMYVVPNLSHLNRYASYIRKKYPKAEIMQTKHYALYNYEKFGFLGTEKEDEQRQWRLRDIASYITKEMGIEWSAYGFKQTDSLQRRLMLRGYEDNAIEWNTKKVYPLSEYTNKDILAYIKDNNLKQPEDYGDNGRSMGTDITSAAYLKWLESNYPDDLKKVFDAFPLTRNLI